MSANNTKKKKSALIGIAFMFIFIAALVFGCGDKPEQPKIVKHNEGELIIHFVDVGQGDCIIIQLPDSKTMIIDGGPRSARNAVLNYIDNLGIKVFDYLLLTHTDEDHCGSLDDVILNYEIKTIFMPDVSTSTITTVVYRTFVEAVLEEENAGATVCKSDFDCDFENSEFGYYMDFVTPYPEDYKRVKSGNAEAINSISPIMMLTFLDKKIMFTGDANLITEEVFFEKTKDDGVDYNVDILKVAHHGSRTSTSTNFLNVVKPEIAVIPVGGKNTYGHPTAELLARLKVCSDSGGTADVYRTDQNGNVIIKLTSDGVNAVISETILEKSSAIVIAVNKADFKTLLAGIFVNIKNFAV